VPPFLGSVFKALLAAGATFWGLMRFQGTDFVHTMQSGPGVIVPCSVLVGVLIYELATRKRSKRL
jgi:hypothetical protein